MKFNVVQRWALFWVGSVPKNWIPCDLQIGEMLSHWCTQHILHYRLPCFPTYLSPSVLCFPLSKSGWVTITCNCLAHSQETRRSAQLVSLQWFWVTFTKLIIPRPMFRGGRGMHQPFIINFSRRSERIRDWETFVPFPYLLSPLRWLRHIRRMVFPKVKLLLYMNTNIYQNSSLVPCIFLTTSSLKRKQLSQYILTLFKYHIEQ